MHNTPLTNNLNTLFNNQTSLFTIYNMTVTDREDSCAMHYLFINVE